MSAMTDGIYTLLTTDQTAGSFYDDLGGRIHTVNPPQNVTLPYCVVHVLDDEPFYYFGADDIDANLQIDLWGDRQEGYDTISDINVKLRTVLHGQAVTITGFTGGQAFNLERGVPTVEEDAIRLLSRWHIWASA